MLNKVDVEKSVSHNSTRVSITKPSLTSQNQTFIKHQNRKTRTHLNKLTAKFRGTSLRRKAIAFAIAIGTLPVLSIGALTYKLVSSPIQQQIVSEEGTKDKAQIVDPEIQVRTLLTVVIATLVLAAISTASTVLVANKMIMRILEATSAVQGLAKGNLRSRVKVQGKDEIASLGLNINRMADQLEAVLLQQQDETDHLKLFTNSLISTRHAEDTDALFFNAVAEVRETLKADRVVVYRLNYQGGEVVAESVAPGLPKAFELKVKDSCIINDILEGYRSGRILAINNVFEAGLAPEHLQLMETLQVKANLVTPIIKNDAIFGFLIAHHCEDYHNWQLYEMNFLSQLSVQIGLALERINLLKDTEAQKNLAIHLSGSHDTQDIYNLAVQDIRSSLQADRVVIYQFDDDWQGSILAESVLAGFPCALGAEIKDPCCKNYVEGYKQGKIIANKNIYEMNLTQCYIQQLETFAVKANLVAPILSGNNLLGLLIAHQCSEPRDWHSSEIDSFKQFARIIGLALERARLLEITKKAKETAEQFSQQQKGQKEKLQGQLLNLLSQIEGASGGDLTVRAEVINGEIGTVADFFNSIIESLREIVTQVKSTATHVNNAIAENSGAINQLADEALEQAQEVDRTLESVKQMRNSIKNVAISARKATVVSKTVRNAAKTGGEAVDLTVKNILGLRETIGETTKQVKRLGESSQHISRIVSLINQIAVQTNILAINAGIEAERAGEGSQGFAVVAEEVSALAARSASATTEIEGIVANIQRETSDVVRAMELGTTQVVEGTTLVEDTKKKFNQILDVSRQIDELVQSISIATVSQVQTSKKVTHLMQDVSRLSEMTSSSSEKVSAYLEKTVEISQALQSNVGTFKID
ncbi:MAG: methyl-accepting chemotaxis protein [Mastigocoleus sp.]